MMSIHHAGWASLFLSLHSFACAGLTYVDAVDGVGGNTTLADGTVLLADNGSTTWLKRVNVTFGSSGTILEGIAPSPEIKTALSGLLPGQSYKVYVHFFEKAGSTVEKWNVRAGFASGSLTLFANASDGLAGATPAVVASTLTYDSAPTLFTGTGTNMAGLIGNATADAGGEIQVFIDDYGSGGVDLRTWYDGISYEPVASPGTKITYVDANTGNTARRDGVIFNPPPDSTTGADNNWEIRNLGNNGTVLESNAEAPENAPLLVTTLSGHAPNTA